MQVEKLRLAGFKSFVDQTELLIQPGVTGIVGPNGCGKSNLVEALRWVMGETSARRMRGAEMDDVIFGGTEGRPARNIAEVTLEVDNGSRTAPAAFNHLDRLQVSRRIERGGGSDYRINGRLVRARDVQLMFQDSGSGAGSPALVSQGRVGALIAAKPIDRRLLLEEAAGISGLHSRRHEAELRLKAAEANLLRLDDVMGAMAEQLASLKKQARQAARYRGLSDQIRKAEAVLLTLAWIAAEAAERAARIDHAANEKTVAERSLASAAAAREQAAAAEALPSLRRAEGQAAEAVQRLLLARDGLEAEGRRVAEAAAEAERRRGQIARDLDREHGLSGEAAEALARLAGDAGRLRAAQQGEAAAEAAALKAAEEAAAAVAALDGELGRLTEAAAAGRTRREAATARLAELAARVRKSAQRREDFTRQKAALEGEAGAEGELERAHEAVAAAEDALAGVRTAAAAADAARKDAETARTRAREEAHGADAALARLSAEAEALAAVLGSGGNGHRNVIDDVTVAGGLESALAAALGEDAAAALDEAAPLHWRALPPLEAATPLPEGAEPLAGHVAAPPALARRLAAIGIVAGETEGRRLAARLAPGQSLVSRGGGHWRWDGLTQKEGAPSAAAVRLAQRNRLTALGREIDAAAETAAGLARRLAEGNAAATAAATAERAARTAVEDAFARLDRARAAEGRLSQAAAQRWSRLEAVGAQLGAAEAEHAAATGEEAALREETAGLPDAAVQRQAADEARARLAEARAREGAARNRLDAVRREAGGRRHRLRAIEEEAGSWRERAAGTAGRLEELEARAADTAAAIAALAARPEAIEAERAAIFERLSEAEGGRRAAADALAAAEQRQGTADRALRAAEQALAEARERRVRAEGAVAAAMAAARTIAERMSERLGATPAETRRLAGIEGEAPLPEAGSVEQRLERLQHERDTVGPVNLRAEAEAREMEERIAVMAAERDDLTGAIARLRHGISSLNREARERLTASFAAVDRHFQELFVRLFGGGRAQLKLTEADDPLDAGLEVFASPPGKRLQHLSLLSGGEQALTALSLIFAVFLTNPAPVCVLDEVDAPLDDANVDRFCSLLAELAEDGATRFLLITHHRMTMARVDRLFGVTMPERGVSQLVSVDLERAAALRQTA